MEKLDIEKRFRAKVIGAVLEMKTLKEGKASLREQVEQPQDQLKEKDDPKWDQETSGSQQSLHALLGRASGQVWESGGKSATEAGSA